MKLVPIVCLTLCSIAFASGSRAGELPAGNAGPPSNKAGHCDSRAGFAALVGTDTCVKIGGRIRADYLTTTFKLKGASGFGQGAAPIRPHAYGGFATSADVDIDARTPTDFGTVRTYVRLRAVNDPNGIYPP
jgi:hypothetical protein